MKRFALAALALLGVIHIAQAINVTGTNSQNENSIVRVGYLRNSVSDTLTAAAGGGQANALQLEASYNRVTTVASGNDSVKLPSCVSGASNTGPLNTATPSGNTNGMVVWITNAAASNSMNVYTQTGQAINALGANNPYAMAANKTSAFICSGVSGIWYSNLGA